MSSLEKLRKDTVVSETLCDIYHCLWSDHSAVLLIYGAEWLISFQVKSRGVIHLQGPDVFKFLQGLVTNDVARLEREPPEAKMPTPSPAFGAAIRPPLYTAMLNAQGRFLYDLFLYRPRHGPGKGDDASPYLLADVDSNVADELVSHLTK